MFRRKYKKNVGNDAVFTAEYTTRLNAIKLFVRDEKLLKEIEALQEVFLFTPITGEAAAKRIRRAIEKKFKKLERILTDGKYTVAEVEILIKTIHADIITHSTRVVHQ